ARRMPMSQVQATGSVRMNVLRSPQADHAAPGGKDSRLHALVRDEDQGTDGVARSARADLLTMVGWTLAGDVTIVPPDFLEPTADHDHRAAAQRPDPSDLRHRQGEGVLRRLARLHD